MCYLFLKHKEAPAPTCYVFKFCEGAQNLHLFISIRLRRSIFAAAMNSCILSELFEEQIGKMVNLLCMYI